MSHRLTAWIIFLGGLTLIGVGATSEVGIRVVGYGIWGLWLVLSAIFIWVYVRTGSPADRSHLIDTRGVYLLPRPMRRWLFDE